MSIEHIFGWGMDRTVNEPLPMVRGFCLNLGAGEKVIQGTSAVDYPEWDADSQPLDFADEEVDSIIAFHFLEHCANPVAVLKDCQRILRPGGHITIIVPYYTSQMAAQDLDHKHTFSEETWKTLFSNPYYDKNRIEWSFKVHLNLIIGVVERNLALMTQLIKEG